VSGSPIPRSYWVVPGRLLAGEYPLERLEQLLAAGVNTFIDLTQPRENESYRQLLPQEVQYLNKPIPDHDVPKKHAHMHDIQAALADALAADRCVYVHCRAGIGRTGTVIGCHLVEQGLTGEAAFAELNRLWQQNQLAAHWPEVPETEAQIQYLLDWPKHRRKQPKARAAAPTDDSAALTAVRSLRERYHGALLGLAVCDALAAATQYRRPGTFVAVGDMLGGGPFDLPRGAWSDDTAMALCLADSLVATDRFDPADQLERYLRWQSAGYLSATGQCVGITASTARALATANWRRQTFAGSHDPAQVDPEPLSRIAPVVLHAFADTRQALDDAADAVRVTCQAPLVLDCARLLAAMLLAALRGESRARLLAPPPAVFVDRPLRKEVAALAKVTPTLAAVSGKHPAGSDALTALQAARWALHSTTSFRAGALAAVNLGGNSDVIGAIYGQLAGAHYGMNAIPRPWREALAQRETIEGLADQLLTTALVRLGDAAVVR
jgi:ADP-ribosylglycohydrolase